VESRRPNECPRCGFAYTAFNRPTSGSFLERFTRSLREQRKHGLGALAKARYAEAEHLRPWQCRCGTWLRASAWSFGWVDLAGVVALGSIHGYLATQFPWLRNGVAFAIPVGLWVGYRLSTQSAVAEVPADTAQEMTGEAQ